MKTTLLACLGFGATGLIALVLAGCEPTNEAFIENTRAQLDWMREQRYLQHEQNEADQSLHAVKCDLRFLQLYIGMSEPAASVVDQSEGAHPCAKRNITQTASHTREQWVWGSGHSFAYFEDGVLTTLQH